MGELCIRAHIHTYTGTRALHICINTYRDDLQGVPLLVMALPSELTLMVHFFFQNIFL